MRSFPYSPRKPGNETARAIYMLSAAGLEVTRADITRYRERAAAEGRSFIAVVEEECRLVQALEGNGLPDPEDVLDQWVKSLWNENMEKKIAEAMGLPPIFFQKGYLNGAKAEPANLGRKGTGDDERNKPA